MMNPEWYEEYVKEIRSKDHPTEEDLSFLQHCINCLKLIKPDSPVLTVEKNYD